jgi:hypothetical protein
MPDRKSFGSRTLPFSGDGHGGGICGGQKGNPKRRPKGGRSLERQSCWNAILNCSARLHAKLGHQGNFSLSVSDHDLDEVMM